MAAWGDLVKVRSTKKELRPWQLLKGKLPSLEWQEVSHWITRLDACLDAGLERVKIHQTLEFSSTTTPALNELFVPSRLPDLGCLGIKNTARLCADTPPHAIVRVPDYHGPNGSDDRYPRHPAQEGSPMIGSWTTPPSPPIIPTADPTAVIEIITSSIPRF